MQGVLTPAIKLCVFGNPGRLQVPTFGSVSFILTLASKWGCDSASFFALLMYSITQTTTQLAILPPPLKIEHMKCILYELFVDWAINSGHIKNKA
jgi:hypothetical protein